MDLLHHRSELYGWMFGLAIPNWMSVATSWLVRHAAWLIARYHTRSRDDLTPSRMLNGADYNHPLATLGEIVLGKIPTMPKGKLQRRWLKGVWLGKLDRDDSHVIGTSAGAIAVRAIRRLPKEAQDKELMNEMKGIGSQETASDTRPPGKYRIQRSFQHQPQQPLTLQKNQRMGFIQLWQRMAGRLTKRE